jgi:hypothetical protein
MKEISQNGAQTIPALNPVVHGPRANLLCLNRNTVPILLSVF